MCFLLPPMTQYMFFSVCLVSVCLCARFFSHLQQSLNGLLLSVCEKGTVCEIRGQQLLKMNDSPSFCNNKIAFKDSQRLMMCLCTFLFLCIHIMYAYCDRKWDIGMLWHWDIHFKPSIAQIDQRNWFYLCVQVHVCVCNCRQGYLSPCLTDRYISFPLLVSPYHLFPSCLLEMIWTDRHWNENNRNACHASNEQTHAYNLYWPVALLSAKSAK